MRNALQASRSVSRSTAHRAPEWSTVWFVFGMLLLYATGVLAVIRIASILL